MLRKQTNTRAKQNKEDKPNAYCNRNNKDSTTHEMKVFIALRILVENVTSNEHYWESAEKGSIRKGQIFSIMDLSKFSRWKRSSRLTFLFTISAPQFGADY